MRLEGTKPVKIVERNVPEASSHMNQVFFSRIENAWVCRGDGCRKPFHVRRTGPDGQMLDAAAYRSVLLAQKAAAEELRQCWSSDLSDSGDRVSHSVSSPEGEKQWQIAGRAGGDRVPQPAQANARGTSDEDSKEDDLHSAEGTF